MIVLGKSQRVPGSRLLDCLRYWRRQHFASTMWVSTFLVVSEAAGRYRDLVHICDSSGLRTFRYTVITLTRRRLEGQNRS